MLNSYPAIAKVAGVLDEYLQNRHSSYFGPEASHPVLGVKRSKVLHDNLWGTNSFSWRELALIDSPLIQRLRDIHQVGLALQTYMCARHSRFEHSIGVVTISSRVFDAVLGRQGDVIRMIIKVLYPAEKTPEQVEQVIRRLRSEMRLAALLHDTGHSLYSHTSERVYSQLPMIKAASEELSGFVAKDKGAGEVLAFCLAQSESVKKLLQRAESKIIGQPSSDDYQGPINLDHVALMIVGRGPHPFLQFLGDIVSSGFDADKLDYLFRDATAAGLPLRYDLDRFLYSIRLEPNVLADDEGELQALYEQLGTAGVERRMPDGDVKFAHYQTYRLRLPREAMNTIEQLVLCKLMLFSYIYHHTKVRAAEGLLEKLLARAVELWRKRGESDEDILKRFMDATDSSIFCGLDNTLGDEIVKTYCYRIVNRLLPREVFGISSSDASHAEAVLLQSFTTDLQMKGKTLGMTKTMEQEMGEELKRLRPELAAQTPEDALLMAGIWFDVPKQPRIEDIEELVVGGVKGTGGVPISKMFPIGEWTNAYRHFKYQARIFSFSEYAEVAAAVGRKAIESATGIAGSSLFYDSIKRQRS